MDELERVRYVTRHFGALQGLKVLPFGLYMILISTRDLGFDWLGEDGDCTYTLPLFLLMFVLYFAIDRYYARRFGTVQQKDAGMQWLYGIAFVAVFFGIVMLEAAVKPPLSIIGLLVTLLLIYTGIRTRRWYYWVIGLVLTLLNFLPFLGGSSWKTFAAGSFGFWWNMIFGLGFCIIGLLDHFRLVHGMKPVQEGGYARAE